MDSYAPLLERMRVPQPSLQRLAVISIFSKLRSSSSDSEAARDAISQCLSSTSPAVVDQSVRELCRLVSESKMDVARGLLELQSALEGADSLFVNVFVKGVGFLIRLGFKENCEAWRECSPETHPLIKILSCRRETQSELRQQVMLIMSQHESFRMREVCDFLRPLLNFSILRIPFLDSPSSTFVLSLVSSMASLACTFRCDDALIILKLLLSCLKFYPQRNEGNLADFACISQSIADAYVVVLKQLTASTELLINGAQLCGVELVETILSRCSELDNSSATSDFVLPATQIISVQKEAGLKFLPQLSTVLVALTVILTKSELEYEQMPVVKLLVLLLNWKNENDHIVGRPVVTVSEGLLCIFPVIKLMSSPSKFVKGAASELLLVLEKHMMQLLSASHKELTWSETRFPSISSPEVIVFRLLQNVWHQDKFTSQSSFLNPVTSAVINDEMHLGSQSWTCNLHKFSLWAVEQRKSSLLSKYGEVLSGEMSLLVCAVACVLIVNDSLKPDAVDTLSAVGTLDMKHGVTILLAILFYINIFSKSEASGEMQLKLLGMLPSLASHSAMVPLIVQTMLPMLVKDTKSVLYATATRLLCKTWEYNDRAFGTLQGCLKPQKFAEFTSERNISISMAACLRDVCRKNPDRGVDLILSVSACIEAHDPPVKALGLECLSHLCEADVIDFYTAWDVITSHLSVNQLDPIVTRSLCLLLRWGATDSEAYPESSESLIRILWDVGTSRHSADCTLWAKVKSTAFEALAHFEFSQLDRSIPEFKAQISDLLTTESDCALLGAIEAIMVKIILYENINRRRLVKEKKVLANKVEKLLYVFPRSIFSSGNNRNVRELPGAALFTASFFPKDKNDSIPKGLQEVHGEYENALIEIAASLYLSRSIFVAVLALKSWEPFMKRWIKANVLSNEGKRTTKISDTTLKAANDILQSLRQAAENSIPRIAENIALAIGALCTILPPSIHSVKLKSTEFLLTWLSSNEHEHRQWTAALSLGVVSRCLHITDHKLKLQVINGLLQVAGNSKSTLVKGACGVGLGLSCKSLLTQAVDAEESGSNNLTIWRQELDVMEKMVKELCRFIFQITRSSSDILRSLCSFPVRTDDEDSESDQDSDWGFPAVEDDIWGVAGLVMGLGNSVGAVYRAGFQDLVVKIKSMLISWISNLQMQGSDSGSCTERCEIALSIGACLALPVIVAFCLRVELIENDEIEYLFHCYKDHISILLLSKDSSNIHQCLLMALCTGAGNLLACILNEGVYSIKVQELDELLQLYRKCYSGPFPPLINIGGMLGAVNVLGAGAGIFLENPDPFSSGQTHHELKGSSSVTGPLIGSSICEPTLILLVQEIFVAARNSEENQLRQYAAWALSFLRHHLLSDANKSSVADMKSAPSIPEDSVVMKLSLWLMHLNYSEKGNITHPNTVATVIRCLSLAPRLPTLDWGAIMRRIMRYELQVADSTAINLADEKTNVRERCLEFSLVHANKVDLLQRFLDELTDLSRFESLDLNLQSLIVQHLSDLIKVFSGSRLQKLFNDIITYLSSSNSFKKYSLRQKSSLRKSVWQGLNECLVEASTDASEHMVYFEKCMKVLFQLLPRLKAVATLGIEDKCFAEEWSAAVLCLEKAQPDWLLDLLQVRQRDNKSEDVQMMEVKKLQTKAKLVGRRSIALSELGRVKTLVLDSKSLGAWDVLIEIVVALQHADSSCRREWLLDAVQMSCISRYPSMVLQFIGLLAGSFCKYMPLLILDRLTVLSDLPVTLKSLLTDPKWEPIAEPVATHLFTAAERIYEWRTCLSHSVRLPSFCNIDSSEDAMADFLFQVLYHTCVSLRHYLPLDKQLKLSDMAVP